MVEKNYLHHPRTSLHNKNDEKEEE